MNIFEQATKKQLRFKTTKGIMTTEDLWTMDLPFLDTLARGLYKEQQDKNVSFIGDTSAEDKVLNLMFDIVKHIIDAKIEEREKAKEEQQNLARRARILEILADKREEGMRNKTEEELLEELKSLG